MYNKNGRYSFMHTLLVIHAVVSSERADDFSDEAFKTAVEM